MTLLEYSKQQFLIDLNSLRKTNCNNIASELSPYIDSKTSFFGGYNWENYENDIMKVAPENRDKFCVCLFTMSSSDQHAHARFPNLLAVWLRYFKYPKFGYCGLGPHFEKVNYLLDVPAAHGINFDPISQEQIDEFLTSQFTAGRLVLGDELNFFFQTMVQDSDFSSDTEIFRKIKKGIVVILN
ncbi:hypothetical protein [Flavobacterium sp. W22_SRS_FP1]|uniref:hypothetical protein n=1 Tax=Flavobacterium sp. W22_SRS_FP1 TaxID=3240276 RepID=UPI003F9359DF